MDLDLLLKLLALGAFGAGAVALVRNRRPPTPPTALVTAPLQRPQATDHAADALTALEAAERQAAARRLEEALGQHYLGQHIEALNLAVPSRGPETPPKPAPKPAPKK